jgi:hypothetical protein
MKNQFGLIQRPWGVYYLKDKVTGEQTSLKTNDRNEAQRLLLGPRRHAQPAALQPALTRVYINGAGPKLGARTWCGAGQANLSRKEKTLAKSEQRNRNPGQMKRSSHKH